MGEHRLQARKVIWAANTHLSHLGFASRRQVPVYTYACLTEPIDATQQTLGEELAWGLTPAEQLEATTRKLTDGRLLFRSGFSYKKELTVSEQRELLFQGIKKRYPNIKEKQIKLWVQEQKKRLTPNSFHFFKNATSARIYCNSRSNASGVFSVSGFLRSGRYTCLVMANVSSWPSSRPYSYKRVHFKILEGEMPPN